MRVSIVEVLQWCVAATLLAVFVLASTPPVWAAVVYSVLRESTWRIYYQADLSAEPQAVSEAAVGDASAPSLAPDGQRVAFEVQGRGIFVCALDAASACERVSPSQETAVRPTWHPVTGELVFVRYHGDVTSEDSTILTTRGALTETGILMTHTGIQDYPDVSTDGRRLAYISSQTVALHRSSVQVVQHLWIAHLDTGILQQLTAGIAQDIQPDWSPAGQKIAFASNRTGQFEIWVVNADGSDLRQVTSGLGAKTWPAWSPDGRLIMFTLAKDGRQTLWLINEDGSHLRPFEPFGPESQIELRDADWQ